MMESETIKIPSLTEVPSVIDRSTEIEEEIKNLVELSNANYSRMMCLVDKSSKQVDQMISLGKDCANMLDEARGRSEHSNKVASFALAASIVSCSVSTIFMILVVLMHGLV